MSLLVRRINRAKWDKFDYHKTDDPPADAMTMCLRTTDDELSTWMIDDIEDIEQAVVGLVTGSKQENLNTIHVVFFDTKLIGQNGLTLINTDGDTVVERLKQFHWDITGLTYTSLGNVKDIIIDCLRNERFVTFTRGTLKKILNTEIKSGGLVKENLNEKLAKEL